MWHFLGRSLDLVKKREQARAQAGILTLLLTVDVMSWFKFAAPASLPTTMDSNLEFWAEITLLPLVAFVRVFHHTHQVMKLSTSFMASVI